MITKTLRFLNVFKDKNLSLLMAKGEFKADEVVIYLGGMWIKDSIDLFVGRGGKMNQIATFPPCSIDYDLNVVNDVNHHLHMGL